jgi:hypothetical protein
MGTEMSYRTEIFHWILLAEQAKQVEKHLEDPQAKQIMRSVVDDYVALARRAASHSARSSAPRETNSNATVG